MMKKRNFFVLLLLLFCILPNTRAQEGWYFIGGYQVTRMQPNTAINRLLYSFNQRSTTTQATDLLHEMRGIVIGYGGSGDLGGIDMIWDRKKADLGTYEDQSRGWSESIRIQNNSFRMMPYLNIVPANALQVSLGLSLDVSTFKTKRYQGNTGRWVLEPGGFLGGFNPTVNSSLFMHFTLWAGPVGLRLTPYAQLPWYYDHFDGLVFATEFYGPIEGALAADQLQYLANYGVQGQILIYLGE